MALVENLSKIQYSKTELMTDSNTQTISWSQSFSNKKEDFVQLLATLSSDGTSKVILFVQKSLAEQLLKNSAPVKEGQDLHEVTVKAPHFRYGQDKATNTTFRFLVYLDPSHLPYQHRFINQTTWSKLASQADKVPDINPALTAVKSAVSVAQNVFGDPLRSFEG